jgi:hypothetical protein
MTPPTTLDALRYPWPAPTNLATAQAERAAERWVVGQGLLRDETTARRYRGVSVGLLAGMTHPTAEPALLELVAQVMAWIFIEDDHYDASAERSPSEALAERFRGYLDVLVQRRAPADADVAMHALADLARRLAARGSASWYRHFVTTMQKFWFEGVLVETWYREQSITPDPASYMATRVQTVGVYVCLALVELDGDHELDAELRTNALVQRTTWLTSRIIAYVNDVFSYEKERRAGDPNNFVHTLRLHHGLDLSAAVARTIQAHDRELAQLLALERALHRTSPEIAERIEPLLAGCRAWMVGALQWQRIATRYATGRALLDPDMQCAATG